jgi:hypothetical protein
MSRSEGSGHLHSVLRSDNTDAFLISANLLGYRAPVEPFETSQGPAEADVESAHTAVRADHVVPGGITATLTTESYYVPPATSIIVQTTAILLTTCIRG